MSPRKAKPTKKIDRDKLHRWLYSQSNDSNRIQKSNTELADLLGIRPDHMGRIMREMVEAGRMRRVGTSRHRVATYEITDPDKFESKEPTKKKSNSRTALKWQ